MGFTVYDYRQDVRNVLVTPQIRSRFLRMEPGEVSTAHTHDLGQEIFLILSGRCEFTIDGESEELGPGQMCVALVDQMHSVRVLGDEPMTMYLSVTPHIQPTHTFWDGEGKRLPPRFAAPGVYDQEIDDGVTLDELLARHEAAAKAVAQTAHTCATEQSESIAEARQALAADRVDRLSKLREGMWTSIFALHEAVNTLDTAWNELVPRLADGDAS